jgi:hypothetical protein
MLRDQIKSITGVEYQDTEPEITNVESHVTRAETAVEGAFNTEAKIVEDLKSQIQLLSSEIQEGQKKLEELLVCKFA